MADLGNISQVTLPNGDVAHLKDSTARLNNIHVVKGTQTATTASWTGEIDVDALYDGLTIAYYLPRTSASNVTLDLTLSNGETTGAKEVYATGTSRMTTHYSAGSTIYLTYWSAGSILINGTASATDRWVGSDWDNNTIGEYAGACTAGPNGMARYSLILQVDENHWESLVTTSSTGTSKAKNSSGFLLSSPIIYQSGGTYASGSHATQGGAWSTYSFDTRYSTNGGSFSVAGMPFYLVGTITGGKFYLKETTWWANELPAQDDGNVYWYVGQFYNSYQCTLYPIHPLYDYIDGEWREIVEYSRNAGTVNGHTVEADVPSNAVFTDTTDLSQMTGTLGFAHGGTGQTSGVNAANALLNQLSTGSSTPTDNDYYISQYVGGGTTTTTYHRRPMSAMWTWIKSKIDAAYTNALTKYAGSDSAGGPANTVKGSAGTDNAYRHVWFSYNGNEPARSYDDDFKYNPATNSVKVSGAYMTYNSTTKSIDFTFE